MNEKNGVGEMRRKDRVMFTRQELRNASVSLSLLLLGRV